MAKKAATTTRGPKTTKRQTRIAGTEPEQHEAIDTLALELRSLRDDRAEIQKEEAEKQEQLIELMHKHKLEHYRIDGTNLEVKIAAGKIKASVVTVKDEE